MDYLNTIFPSNYTVICGIQRESKKKYKDIFFTITWKDYSIQAVVTISKAQRKGKFYTFKISKY